MHSNDINRNPIKLIQESLNKSIKKKDIQEFSRIITKNRSLLTDEFCSSLINLYIENNLSHKFLLLIINEKKEPNIIINSKGKNGQCNPGKSILMLAIEKGNYFFVKDLCEGSEERKKININYCDKNGRNALFYLRSGNDNRKIIECLVKNGITINQKDLEDNTPLIFLAMNSNDHKLIYDLIDIANPNLMLKNKKGKNALEIINENYILNKNIIKYEDIKPLIKLIKTKLSFKNSPVQNDNNYKMNELIDNINNNNLIKLSSLSTMPTSSNENGGLNELGDNGLTEKNSKDNNINIYVQSNPLSLIIDNHYDDKNNISTSKKIDNYTQINKNKKQFLNMLKSSENQIKEEIKLIKLKIEKRKEELKSAKEKYLEKEKSLHELSNSFSQKLDNDINTIENNIKDKKQKLLKNYSESLYDIESKNFLYKYSFMTENKKNFEYIYSQLRIDLLDFMSYVNYRNNNLKYILDKLNNLMNYYVMKSLGDQYQLKIYGSRATKLCLPWSDIDYVISGNDNNNVNDILQTLNDYLLNNNDNTFIDIKYLFSAAVPILKLLTNQDYHKISLDISIENPEHHGEECVNYIKGKIKEYEILTPITLALKTILQEANLNNPYNGGLSSYGVILLVIYYLKMQQMNKQDISMKNVGKIFYDMLYYYGYEYDINNPIIVGDYDNINEVKSRHLNYENKKELVIVDPLNVANNVAKNTRQYQNLFLAFKIVCVSTKESCECGCHYQYSGINIKEEGCEHNLLNKIFNDVKRNINS